jgi:predicted transcriptional regulator
MKKKLHHELRIALAIKGERQKDLMKVLGISEAMVSYKLNGLSKFKQKEKEKLAKHFKKTIEELGL